MNYFNRNKWWAIAFMLLVALNVATLLTFWLVKEKHGRPPGPPSGVIDFLTKELSFDSIQKQKLVELLEEQQQNMREIRRNNRGAKDKFFALLKQDAIPDSAIENAARESARYDSQMDVLTFKHFQQLRSLCNETQKKKFDSILQQVLHMIAPPPGGGPRGGPPPNGEHPPHDGPPPGEDGREPPPQHPQ